MTTLQNAVCNPTANCFDAPAHDFRFQGLSKGFIRGFAGIYDGLLEMCTDVQGVEGLGFGLGVLAFGVWDLECKVLGLGFCVQGFEFGGLAHNPGPRQ